MTDLPKEDAVRLEQLWGSEFGDAYVDRNLTVSNHRGPFWFFDSCDDEHGFAGFVRVSRLFDSGALMINIEIMIKPAAQFFSEASHV